MGEREEIEGVRRELEAERKEKEGLVWEREDVEGEIHIYSEGRVSVR